MLSHSSIVRVAAPLALAALVVSSVAGAQGAPPVQITASVVAIPTVDWNVSTVVVADLAGGPYWPGGPRATDPAVYTWPGGATAADILGPSNARYDASFGKGYDGVANLIVGTANGSYGCTGALIDARHVLTAAHCVSALTLGSAVTSVQVGFLDATGGVTQYAVGSAGVTIMPGYTGSVIDERDLAVLTLGEAAAPWIPRYAIYTDNPLFQTVYEVGFGATGNGVTGDVLTSQFDATPIRRVGLNRFELTRDAFFLYADEAPVTNILVADFDGADPGGVFPIARGGVTGWAARTLVQNDANCQIVQGAGLDPALVARICDQGYGLDEVLTGAGDSGGPAFIRDAAGRLQLVAVASFGNVACYPDQRLDAAGLPAPRTDPGCPVGFVLYGSRFGMRTGHVFAGGVEQAAFIRSVAPEAFVPEPATLALFASGLIGLAIGARRRRRS